MRTKRRGIVAGVALAATGLACAWLVPLAIGDDQTTDSNYDGSTRTVTVTTKSKHNGAGKGNQPPPPRRVVDADPQCVAQPEICDPTDIRGLPSPAQLARQAVAQLSLPAVAPVFGPSPSQNQWHMVPVGYPVWLWVGNTTTTMSRAVTQQGLAIELEATRQSVRFNMGDGHFVTCTSFTQRPAKLTGDPMKPSPTCGYVYSATGSYTLRATTTWLIRWAASGQSGSFTVTDTASAASPLVIGELRTVITTPR